MSLFADSLPNSSQSDPKTRFSKPKSHRVVLLWHSLLPLLSSWWQPPLPRWTLVKFIISLALLLAISCSDAFADDWQSPIESELKNTNPDIYKEYHQARTLLDGYQGKRAPIQQAHDLLLGIIEVDRNVAPVLRELGRLYIIAAHFGGEQFDEHTLKVAEDSILRSISLAPKYEDAYVLLGHLYTKMNQYDKASDALNQAATLESKSPWLNLNLADLYVKTKRFDEALELTQAYINTKPTNSKAETTAHQLRINAFSLLGKMDDAKKAHESLLLVQPDKAQHWANYASLLLYSFSDAEGATTAAKRSLSINENQRVRFTLTLALYMQWANIVNNPERKDEALLLFEKARGYFPDQTLVADAAGSHTVTKEMSKTLKEYLIAQQP